MMPSYMCLMWLYIFTCWPGNWQSKARNRRNRSRRSANQPGIGPGRCVDNWQVAMNFGPNVLPRRSDQGFPERPVAQAQPAAYDHGFRVEDIDEQTDTGPQRFAGRTHHIRSLWMALHRGGQHLLSGFRTGKIALVVAGDE